MVIDALDLLYTDRPEAFGIVSSDADFTPLVMYLRAKGAAVYGFGAQEDARAVRQRLLALPLSRQAVSEPPRASAASISADTRRPGPRRCGGARRLRVPTAKLNRTASWSSCCATRSRLRRAKRLGAGRGGRPADRQPGLVRPTQLRLRDAHQAAQGEPAVRARPEGSRRSSARQSPGRSPEAELCGGDKRKGDSSECRFVLALEQRVAPDVAGRQRYDFWCRFLDQRVGRRLSCRPFGGIGLALRSSLVTSLDVFGGHFCSPWSWRRRLAESWPDLASALVWPCARRGSGRTSSDGWPPPSGPWHRPGLLLLPSWRPWFLP